LKTYKSLITFYSSTRNDLGDVIIEGTKQREAYV